MKLSIVRNMKRLRICILESVCPSGSVTLCSASLCTLACGGSRRLFWTRGVRSHVAASGFRTILHLMILAAGTLSLLTFHNVLPVILSISPPIILESCALNAGLPIGFSAVIIQAGVVAPLPLLPPLPLPLLGCLGNVVARMLHPLEGMLRCTDVGLIAGWFSGGFDK